MKVEQIEKNQDGILGGVNEDGTTSRVMASLFYGGGRIAFNKRK